VLWITCGNTSNARLKEILQNTLASAIVLLEAGEKLVEISGV
jgi:predicted nuclease of predicted toxin-antitoxin system